MVFIFRRLKINHDSHEFILESGTVTNNYYLGKSKLETPLVESKRHHWWRARDTTGGEQLTSLAKTLRKDLWRVRDINGRELLTPMVKSKRHHWQKA